MARPPREENDEIVAGFDEESSSYLRIRLRRVAGKERCLALVLSGSIDAYNSNYFRRSVMKVIDAGFIQIALVLPEVDYVSSTGVGALLTVLRTLMEKGGGLSIVNPHPKVMEILKLMHLHTFFSCSDSVEEALAGVPAPHPHPFPRRLACPVCDKALRADKAGRFRCPACSSVLLVDDVGKACLG